MNITHRKVPSVCLLACAFHACPGRHIEKDITWMCVYIQICVSISMCVLVHPSMRTSTRTSTAGIGVSYVYTSIKIWTRSYTQACTGQPTPRPLSSRGGFVHVAPWPGVPAMQSPAIPTAVQLGLHWGSGNTFEVKSSHCKLRVETWSHQSHAFLLTARTSFLHALIITSPFGVLSLSVVVSSALTPRFRQHHPFF